MDEASEKVKVSDCFSELDRYAMHSTNTAKADAYRRATLKILLSDCIAFGNPELLDGLTWMLRMSLNLLQTQCLMVLLTGLVKGYSRDGHSGSIAFGLLAFPAWKALKYLI